MSELAVSLLIPNSSRALVNIPEFVVVIVVVIVRNSGVVRKTDIFNGGVHIDITQLLRLQTDYREQKCKYIITKGSGSLTKIHCPPSKHFQCTRYKRPQVEIEIASGKVNDPSEAE